MIAVFDVWKDVGAGKAFTQGFRHIDIIDAPTFILQTDRRESLAPPGVPAGRRIENPQGIHPAAFKKTIHPCTLLRQEAGRFLIPFGIVDINFPMGDIVIAAKDQSRILFSRRHQE